LIAQLKNIIFIDTFIAPTSSRTLCNIWRNK